VQKGLRIFLIEMFIGFKRYKSSQSRSVSKEPVRLQIEHGTKKAIDFHFTFLSLET